MMMLVGTFNVINGFAAVFADDIFISGSAGSVVLDVTGWGWVHVVLGALLVVIGIGVLQGATWAVIAGIIVVMVNMVTQMLALPSYPFWSIVIITLDVLVLWALTVHGDERLSDL
jgi:hypothetical protein